MTDLSRKSFQRIAQSMDMDYDDKVDSIYEVFLTPYAQGAMNETLSNFLNNLEWAVTDAVDSIGSEFRSSWTRAVSSFVDELEREGFDVSQIDVEEVAAKAGNKYIEDLKSNLKSVFDNKMSFVEDSDSSHDVLEDVTGVLTEGY